MFGRLTWLIIPHISPNKLGLISENIATSNWNVSCFNAQLFIYNHVCSKINIKLLGPKWKLQAFYINIWNEISRPGENITAFEPENLHNQHDITCKIYHNWNSNICYYLVSEKFRVHNQHYKYNRDNLFWILVE